MARHFETWEYKVALWLGPPDPPEQKGNEGRPEWTIKLKALSQNQAILLAGQRAEQQGVELGYGTTVRVWRVG